MNLYEFLENALEPNAYERPGQRLMTFLWNNHQKMYVALIDTKLDTFYEDRLLYKAVEFIVKNWDRYVSVDPSSHR